MKESEVRLIQKYLANDNFYKGRVDGKRGKETDNAIVSALQKQSKDIPDNWKSWSSKRKAISYLQLQCRDNGIDPGKIDGLYGPQTESASDQLRILNLTGSLPRGFGDIVPIRANPHNFPIERNQALTEYYGKPCEARLIKVPCPWTLRLDWDLKSTTNTISIHEKLSDSLAKILQESFDIYKLKGIKKLGLD